MRKSDGSLRPTEQQKAEVRLHLEKRTIARDKEHNEGEQRWEARLRLERFPPEA